MYQTIWGQGALFCFSGIDGENTMEGSLPCTLCGDKLGISLYRAGGAELYFALTDISDMTYQIVGGDIILFNITPNGGIQKQCGLIFYKQNIIIGQSASNASPKLVGYLQRVNDEGDYSYIQQDETKEYIALYTPSNCEHSVFALAYSNISLADARQQAFQAIEVSFKTQTANKLAFFDCIPANGQLSNAEAQTLYKCFSVMKTQVYTPEGRFDKKWTTPDRLPHQKSWLWDSVFHALGNRHISVALAIETIESIFAYQRDDGFISHMADPINASLITQPPVIAWGLYEIYKFCNDTNLLERNYTKLKTYLCWNMNNRDSNNNFLYEWYTNNGSTHNSCDESGMDNSPRFDDYKAMDCIDFSCYMANEARTMKKIAQDLEYHNDVLFWNNIFETIKNAINNSLWDKESGFYYDCILCTGEFKKVQSISSFLPLFAGICDEAQAAILVDKLQSPLLFSTPLPLASVSKTEPSYATDMWRGPVWINYNYLMMKGLSDYGYHELSADICQKSISAITHWYMQEGVLYEFYDSENLSNPKRMYRKGVPIEPYRLSIRMQTIKDYGWTASLFADMILTKRS